GVREFRLQPVVGVEHVVDEVHRHRREIELLLAKREKARLRFLDDADLDIWHERKTPTRKTLRERAVRRARRQSLSRYAPVPTGFAIAQPLPSRYASIASRATAALADVVRFDSSS